MRIWESGDRRAGHGGHPRAAAREPAGPPRSTCGALHPFSAVRSAAPPACWPTNPNTRVDVATRALAAPAALLLFAAFTRRFLRALPPAFGRGLARAFTRGLLRGLLRALPSAAAPSAGCFPAARLSRSGRLAGACPAGAAAGALAAFALALGGTGADVARIRHGGSGQVVVAHSHPVVEIVLHDRLAVKLSRRS